MFARARHQGPHGNRHIDRQRVIALTLAVTGFARAGFWAAMIASYFAGLTLVHSLFNDVWFVAILSLYANGATDFGQACASLAQLAASDAHHDAEHTRRALIIDTALIEHDISQLAGLQPGPEAQMLAEHITARLKRVTP